MCLSLSLETIKLEFLLPIAQIMQSTSMMFTPFFAPEAFKTSGIENSEMSLTHAISINKSLK